MDRLDPMKLKTGLEAFYTIRPRHKRGLVPHNQHNTTSIEATFCCHLVNECETLIQSVTKNTSNPPSVLAHTHTLLTANNTLTFGDGLVGNDEPLTEHRTDGGPDGRTMNELDDEQVRLHSSQSVNE